MRARSLLWLLPILWSPLTLAAPPESDAAAHPQDLDAYVLQVMHDWYVPGLAIAVVRDDKVVLARGYGVRELGKPGKVDADTLFDIASNSKAFTAAALGTLVSSGKLKWDTPVTDELHAFRFDNAYVTQNITLRDLLTHRSGYCDPSAVWFTSDASDILKRIRFQKPDFGFRAAFCYNNVQYLAASRFIPALTGESWNDYVATHLFQPLGMARTVSTMAAVDAASDVSAPHGMVNDEPAVIRPYWPHNMDIFASVGGIWSSANDMSHWMQMLLDGGTYGGKTVLDAKIVRAMETPEIPIQSGTEVGDLVREWMPGGDFYTYGLGLFVQDYHGHKLVWHAGDIDGMASAMALLPDEHLGIVVLSNMNQANARFAIVARVLQTMLDLPQDDIEAKLLAGAKKEQEQGKAMKKELAGTRRPGAKTSLPLSAYAGTYSDDLDGTARVELDHGHLVLKLGNPAFTGDLQHWHDNTFRVTWRYRFYDKNYVTFDLDALGKSVKLDFTGLPLHFERTKIPKANAPD